MVNADDYGLTEGVSRAILHAHRHGIVTSTSVLALAPAFAETVTWLADAPELGCGAHLAAVGEDPPLLSAREIPSLVDRRGHLWSNWKVFLTRAAAGRIDPDDLRREFEAQIEAIESAGVTIDHLDSHQNIHLWPMVAEVVTGIGGDRGVRCVRVMRSGGRGVVGVTVRRLGRRFERRLAREGWSWPEASTGLDEAGRLDEAAMIRALERLASSGASSAELATHPGEADDPARHRYRWEYQWGDELAALCSERVARTVADCGFRLGRFSDLAPVNP